MKVLPQPGLFHPRSSKTSVVTALPSITCGRTCGRTTIPLVDSTLLLGVIIDSNLSLKEHVAHVCPKNWCSETVFPAALSSGKTVILPLDYSAPLRLWFSSHYSQHCDVSTEAPCCNLAKSGKRRGRKRVPRGCSTTFEGIDD